MSDQDSLSAALLVAMPQLQDPNFRRTVMLIVEHSEDGAFGLVLNRDVDLSAATLCASLDVLWCGNPSANIRWGGPVEPNTGWLLFNEGLTLDSDSPEVTHVRDGIYLARSLEILRAIAGAPPSDVSFFLGYAGWGPGQLEGEMTQGAWLVAPSDPDVVFGVAPDAMWDHVVRGLGIDPATLVPTQGVH